MLIGSYPIPHIYYTTIKVVIQLRYCVEKQRMACMAWITHCYGQIEDSLDKCKPDDQLILKNHIFDMFDRVKFLLDKKYAPNPQGYTDNPKIIKGDSVMRYEHEKTRRHAENTIAEANRHLDSGKIRKPRHHQMLTNMIKEATETINNLDRMDDARPYSDTHMGYGARTRERETRQMLDDAMDAIDRILPHLDNAYADDDRYDDDMDDVDARRGRPRRTRRGVGRWTQVRRHVRRMPRGEMADTDDDMHYDDDRYDDARRADEARRTAEEARRMADDARRIADEARRAVDDARPVMDHTSARYDRTDDDRRPGPNMDRR